MFVGICPLCSNFAASKQRPAPRRTPRGQSIAHGQTGIALAQPPRRPEPVVIVGTSPADAFAVVVDVEQQQRQSECNVALGGVGAVVGRLGLQHDGHDDVEELVVSRGQKQQLQEVRSWMKQREREGREVFPIVVNFRLCSQIEEMPEEDEEGDGEDIEADFDDSEMTTTAVDPSEMKEVRGNALYDPSFLLHYSLSTTKTDSRRGLVGVPAAEVALPRPEEPGAGEGPRPAAAAARPKAATALVGIDGQRLFERPRDSVQGRPYSINFGLN